MEGGLVDADLGGGIFKKRVALPGRGKRGSVRTHRRHTARRALVLPFRLREE
nr:type II toxin-antitoxin system RelE/ParE family toxin [Stenotrophomonas sp. CFS3442]